ncbi:acyl-CoA dehydrogenase family protein [Sulfobacillus harzensis]|uniref:Acyl-CoA/acyl-ACP dehydrogenase n=1 Tax=Sulfobacillus harzensis TaxID=2729629 RepID=A0A7Y0Q3S9_9FIRM|nr:acyl-CoA dehydrogenase family protein [Sulfobacillus harzensis]NMP23311.1 acyl-CoA/acyl-ACP dehydrogenase [Sulfobacillus harzensis]
MDFSYSDEQFMMYDSVLGLMRQEAGPSACRKTYRHGSAVARQLAGKLADQGVLGGGASEAHGGSGLSLLDYALLFEAAGQTLLPFPLVESFVVTTILQAFGEKEQQERWLSAIVSGETIPTIAWGDDSGRFGTGGVQAVRARGRTRLFGRRKFVPFAEISGLVLTPVYSTELNGVFLTLLDPHRAGVEIEPLHSLDGSYPLASLILNGCTVEEGELVWQGGNLWERALALAQVALAQEALGVAEEVFRNTVEYVKVREQFGGPVGRFQAVKHVAAEDYLLLESTRVANRYAAWLVSEGSPEGPLYAKMAKAYASDMARRVTGDAIQLHGGIGFTWDSDVHLYFKRAWRLAQELGRSTDLREQMARRVVDGQLEEGDGYGYSL